MELGGYKVRLDNGGLGQVVAGLTFVAGSDLSNLVIRNSGDVVPIT